MYMDDNAFIRGKRLTDKESTSLMYQDTSFDETVFDEVVKPYQTDYNSVSNEYMEWLISKGKAKQGMTDVFIVENSAIKTEQRMATTVKCTPEDWKEFCEETGRDYEQKLLVAIY